MAIVLNSRNTSTGRMIDAPIPTQEVGRCRQGCHVIDVWLQNASYGILHHFLWRTLIIGFTIVLLVGPPCQRWFIPMAGDWAMNALYMIGFVIFVMDMIFNCYLDPKYFPLLSCGTHHSTRTHTGRKPCFPGGYIGSFNFWCDLSSTICFLLAFDGVLPVESLVYDIQLNDAGFPPQGEFAEATNTNERFFRNEDAYLILLIFKTTRVARLVPAITVVELSATIDIFWYLNRMNPCFYWKLFHERRESAKRAEQKIQKKATSKARDSSWDGMEVAALATAKALKEKERRIKENGKLVYAGYIMKKWALTSLRFLRILPNTNVELNRQIAATKIQRAWRSRNATDPDLIDGEGGHAWTSSGRDHSNEVFDSSRRFGGFFGSIRQDFRASLRSSATPKLSAEDTSSQVLKRRRGKKAVPSQVGTAMAEVTGQTVAAFLLANLLLVLIFTYTEVDTTEPSTMVALHGQTIKGPPRFTWKAVDTARRSSIPNLYKYTAISETYNVNVSWTFGDIDKKEKRPSDFKQIKVHNRFGESVGWFDVEADVNQGAKVELVMAVFVLLTWFFGVAAFAGPIMVLVIVPIERAVKLLNMLVMDPLGYQNTLQYKNFLTETDHIAKNGRWSRDVLRGMETEFLMSTIVRIGSLMKVGFGSAGVEIIRNNLQESEKNDAGTLILSSKGSMVSCIFLFCDIRSFTDATECLQEEVFVFTNQVAAVVHSICNSYGGSANKNIGDAFLVSWKLEEGPYDPRRSCNGIATRNQADKALLSVVKICIALHHNEFYVKLLSNHAKTALLRKFKERSGPTVQLGFGLHAGKAVEGAIGSQRKIDATYVSMAVETAEYLETSTKKYGVKMLMSGSFHRLLQPNRRKRCRKIDRVMFEHEDEEFYEEDLSNQGKMMDLFTYDIDVDALWEDQSEGEDINYVVDDENSLSDSEHSSLIHPIREFRRNSFRRLSNNRESSNTNGGKLLSVSSHGDNQNITAAIAAAAAAAKALRAGPGTHTETNKNEASKTIKKQRELVLPTGPALYSENVWSQPDMRRIRRRYTTEFFDTFNRGLQKFYAKEWDSAKAYFESNLERFEDGPSKYFLAKMESHNGKPPTDFQPFGKA